MLTTSFPRGRDDYAGVFVYALASRLVRQGIEVKVVAPHDAGATRYEVMDAVKVSRFIYMFPTRWQKVAYSGGIPANLRRHWLAWAQLPFFCLNFIVAGLKACRRCDLIHAHWLFSGLIALLLRIFYDCPIVLTVHGSDLNLLSKFRFFKWLAFYVLKRVDKVIVVSQLLSNTVQTLGIHKEAIALIPNGVDIVTFPYAGNKTECGYQLLWAGRMSTEKGLQYLIKAMPAVLAKFPQSKLTLVGDGPARRDIERLISELELSNSVCLMGQAAYKDVPFYMAQADLFVLPSLSEGLPLVLLEALSVGRPVVATAVGGIPDVLLADGDKPSGCLVPAGDSQSLAEAIIALLAQPENGRRMGQNGRRLVETHYTWSAVAKRTLDVYRSVV